MTVLIVDHLPERREPIGEAVRARGESVRYAASLEEAMTMAEQQPLRAVLAELRLPGQNGITLARRLKERWPELQVVLVGTDASAREYKEAMQAGVTEVLTTDPTAESVGEVLDKALDLQQGRFTGLVHGMSLTDILQMLHFTRRSATVRLGSGSERIHLRDGQIIHAVSGDYQGKAALRLILTRRSGAMFTAPPEVVEPTIEENFEALLLDLMRDIDEASRPRGPASSPVNLEAIAPAPSEDLPPASEAPTEVESADLLPIESSNSIPVAPPPAPPTLVAQGDSAVHHEHHPKAPVAPPVMATVASSSSGPVAVASVASAPRPTPVAPLAPLPEARTFVIEAATPTPLEVDDDPEPVEVPAAERSWTWLLVLLLFGAVGGGFYFWTQAQVPPTNERGLRGERVADPPPPPPVAEPTPTPPPPPPSVSTGSTAALAPTPTLEPRRVTITTRPAGLVIIDHGTGLPLGNAPVELTVPESGLLSVRAKNGGRVTPELQVRPNPDQAEVELDLRSWVQKATR
ncbi:MAG: response regulator [Deltaproteobacteria bacterium]|nr:response regulator [Deltaproteobacteria bacterium]